MLIVGVLIISLGTVLCKKTSLGIDPFNAFCVGISETISLNLGTTTLLINAALISVILLTGRSFIGIGTVLTMVSIGYFISFFDRILPNVSFDLFAIPNILLFVVGMLIMLDSLTSLIAFIFGGPISVGTIILAGGLGPLIDFFRELIQKYRGLEGNRNLEKVD